MPKKTVKRRLQDCDTALASDDGPIFSTVAKLVEALKRSIPEGTYSAELKRKPCDLGANYFAGPSTKRREGGWYLNSGRNGNAASLPPRPRIEIAEALRGSPAE
jgi:hypothetical protein